MSMTKVGSHTKVKPEDRVLIIKEATRLNGTAVTAKGIKALRQFAQQELGIIVDEKTVRRLLSGHQHGQKADTKTKRRSVRCAHHH